MLYETKDMRLNGLGLTSPRVKIEEVLPEGWALHFTLKWQVSVFVVSLEPSQEK